MTQAKSLLDPLYLNTASLTLHMLREPDAAMEPVGDIAIRSRMIAAAHDELT